MKDYYQILGLAKGASEDQIKSAYRKLAMKHHPDRGGDPTVFQEVQEAYNTLGDPGKRAEYDNPQPQFHGQGPFQGGGVPPGFDDLFRFFGDGFGGNPFFRHTSMPRNRNINLRATITLEDAFKGKELLVNVNLPSGQDQVLNVKIPPGVQDGVSLRLAGMGDNSIPQAPRGDIIVEVSIVPHPKFTRQGDDLIQEIRISCIDAIIGKDIVIDTIEGKQFTGSIPAGTQPDAILALTGQGMPLMANPSQRGRMLLKINMFVPTLSTQQQDILRKL
jgi:curved DNA-binding protein